MGQTWLDTVFMNKALPEYNHPHSSRCHLDCFVVTQQNWTETTNPKILKYLLSDSTKATLLPQEDPGWLVTYWFHQTPHRPPQGGGKQQGMTASLIPDEA